MEVAGGPPAAADSLVVGQARADRGSMIRLVGPGGAGKSSTGLLLAERLGLPFVDLDERFDATVGDIRSTSILEDTMPMRLETSASMGT